MIAPTPHSTSSPPSYAWYWNFGAIVVFWAVYLFIQVPVPGINEPHYLCKAKHFWQPGYGRGDFFLDSANTHYVFYSTFGWLTLFLPLWTVAIAGRVISIGMLAASWTSLARRVSPVHWAPAGSAAIFLGLTSFQNFSGEWIVGGLESKVIAYGCLFYAWSCLFDQKWYLAAILMGVAISFHPVVAGWGLISTCLGVGLFAWQNGSDVLNLSAKKFGCCFVMTLVCSLPGLIPALTTILTPIDRAAEADQLQVFRRLGHHLNPVQFPTQAYWAYGGLLLLWGILVCYQGSLRKQNQQSEMTLQQHVWQRIVLGSLLVAFGGLAIGWGNHYAENPAVNEWLVKLMKFYPFRLADVVLPLAVSLLMINLAQRDGQIVRWRSVTLKLSSLIVAATALLLILPSRNVDGYSASKTESWIDVCHWIDGNVSNDAIVLAPRSSVTFRWYSSRAAYVTFKDCPQDAAGILEWNRRLSIYQDWASRSFENDKQFSEDELIELVQLTQATHLLVSRMGPFEREPTHRNEHYRFYELPKIED
ncbi:MAG: hypothetical protein P8M30_09845 [Planctomycetaceae bacterium]|nr:hypothetical protein [Planctomycetaceae bacterium]MDG2389606.1 hypothetical protein [Planctomycetaceae bacterium]